MLSASLAAIATSTGVILSDIGTYVNNVLSALASSL